MDYSKLRIFAGAICLLVLMLLCGCTHKVYVPVERTVVHTDTLRLFTARVDSFYLHDSTVIMQSGDTVRITRYRDRLRNRLRVDTIYRAIGDTVREPVPYPVERKLTAWQHVKQAAGGWAIGALFAAALAALIIWIIKKRRRK